MKSLLFLSLLLKIGLSFSQNEVCSTKHCQILSQGLSKLMDRSVDPCEDFASFACGGFYKNQTIPAEDQSFHIYKLVEETIYTRGKQLLEIPINDNDFEAHKKAKNYYKACMNVKRQNELKGKPLLEKLREIGGWPLLEGKNWTNQCDVWNATAKLRSLGYSANYVLSISVGAAFWNNTIRSIYINSPTLGLSRNYLLNGMNDKKVQAYFR